MTMNEELNSLLSKGLNYQELHADCIKKLQKLQLPFSEWVKAWNWSNRNCASWDESDWSCIRNYKKIILKQLILQAKSAEDWQQILFKAGCFTPRWRKAIINIVSKNLKKLDATFEQWWHLLYSEIRNHSQWFDEEESRCLLEAVKEGMGKTNNCLLRDLLQAGGDKDDQELRQLALRKMMEKNDATFTEWRLAWEEAYSFGFDVKKNKEILEICLSKMRGLEPKSDEVEYLDGKREGLKEGLEYFIHKGYA